MSAHKIQKNHDRLAECHPTHCSYTVMSELMPYARNSSALDLAFALRSTKLSLYVYVPYNDEVA